MQNDSISLKRLVAIGAAILLGLSMLGALETARAWQGRGAAPPQPAPAPFGAPQNQGPPPTGTSLILGKVLDAGNRSPVSGAIVTMSGTAQAAVGPGGQTTGGPASVTIPARRVMTDSLGRFTFRDLPKGSYRLSATASGYAPTSYGQKRLNGPSRSLEIQDGQKVGDATLLMWKFGAISGTVLDDGGEPAVGVNVRVLTTIETSGRRRLSPGQQTQTDDRGIYRIGGLSPGDYVVVVPTTVVTMPVSVIDDYNKATSAPPPPPVNGVPQPNSAGQAMTRDLQSSGGPFPSGQGFRVSDALQVQFSTGTGRGLPAISATLDGRMLAYQTVFYPAATTSSQASLISLTSGEERENANVQLRLVRTVSVSGNLTGPDGPHSHFGLRLVPAGVEDMNSEPGFETATTVTDANGGFTFLGVAPGAYTIKGLKVAPVQGGAAPERVAMQLQNGLISAADAARLTAPPAPLPSEPTLWAQLPVAVAETNLIGVSVTLRTGLAVSGRIEFDGTSPKPPAEAVQRLRISLSPADGRAMRAFPQGQIAADGTFSTPGLPPGAYNVVLPMLNVPGASWTVKSIMSGGRDVAISSLVLDSADVGGVTIRYTDRPPSELSGTIRVPQSATDINVAVMAFPADYQAWLAGGMNSRASRSGPALPNGTFRLTGLPPGEYFVAAYDGDLTPTTGMQKFFESLARLATRVKIAESEKKTLDLSLVTVR